MISLRRPVASTAARNPSCSQVGKNVILAARIAGQAQGGEILVASVVRELAEGKDFLFADRGEANLKGFEEPVRLYEVRWGEEG